MTSWKTSGSRVRALFVALCLALAVTVVLGASSAGATNDARKKWAKVTVLSTEPANPIAAQTWTITFVVARGEERLQMKPNFGKDGEGNGGGCLAMVGRMPVPPLEQKGDGTVAHCTWRIPSNAAGQTLYGWIAVHATDGVTYNRGFEYPIG